ncbi:MAG: hypothetical protein ACTTKL_07075 [Treponema sp.]
MKRKIAAGIAAALIFAFAGCKDDIPLPSGSKDVTERTGLQSEPRSAHSITGVTLGREFGKTPLKIEPQDKVSLIQSVWFNGKEGQRMGASISVFKDATYFIDTNAGAVYIPEPKAGLVIAFKGADGILGSFEYDGAQFTQTPDVVKTLQVKLVGAFEAAVINQKKYDGVSGASGSISSHSNSNVTVLITEKSNPQESDWIKIESSNNSFSNSKMKITENGADVSMGMKAVFIKHASAVKLQGVPTREGHYKVSVELRDNYGRTAISNELPFSVYAAETLLSEALKTGVAKNGAWDMEPWSIQKFGNGNETVTVPHDVKRWFGSHQSGTYGVLGYPVENDAPTTQTLVIESEVKLINVMTMSSVNILVKSGGKLNLQDSSIHGTITVENGGVFQMNYDTHNNKYASGAQINGKLILNAGATLENSLIYSNTNFLPNGNKARHNESPVVEVTGNVTVKGKVYVRGDEAATGTSSATGKLLTGQPALTVKNGTLTIASGAELGAFGGGRIATTSIGGAALILDNGTVAGDGKLIAVAGSSFGDDGAIAVDTAGASTGTNSISVKTAFLQGGNTYRKSKSGGAPYKIGSVTIGEDTVGVANNGKYIHGFTGMKEDQPSYWSDILLPPPVDATCQTGNEKLKK